jgi:hypothetical protein
MHPQKAKSICAVAAVRARARRWRRLSLRRFKAAIGLSCETGSRFGMRRPWPSALTGSSGCAMAQARQSRAMGRTPALSQCPHSADRLATGGRRAIPARIHRRLRRRVGACASGGQRDASAPAVRAGGTDRLSLGSPIRGLTSARRRKCRVPAYYGDWLPSKGREPALQNNAPPGSACIPNGQADPDGALAAAAFSPP